MEGGEGNVFGAGGRCEVITFNIQKGKVNWCRNTFFGLFHEWKVRSLTDQFKIFVNILRFVFFLNFTKIVEQKEKQIGRNTYLGKG